MLSQSRLTQSFWVEALVTTFYFINHMPNASLKFKVCEELWTKHLVFCHRLETFGCEAYAHVSKELHAKLDPKSQKCIFVGYGLDGQFGYCLWDPESRSILRNNDVVFNEIKMHKQRIEEGEFRKVTFSDVPPPMPIA